MYMNLNNLIICHTHNRITQRTQILLEIHLIIIRKLFVQHDNKLCTITKLDVSFSLRRNLHNLGTFSCIKGKINFLAHERIKRTLKNNDKTLSAGIHNTCFLQNRQHIRSLLKNPFSFCQDIFKERLQILCFISQFQCLISNTSGYGQNRTFFRLHNCFIGCLNTFINSSCDRNSIQCLVFFDSLSKTSQKLRKDNT